MSGDFQVFRLVIEGMTCTGCAKTVTALLQKAGFEVKDMDHETGIAMIKGIAAQIDSAKNLVEAAGYKIKEVIVQK